MRLPYLKRIYVLGACLLFISCGVMRTTYNVTEETVKATYKVTKFTVKAAYGTGKVIYKVGEFTFKVVAAPLSWPLMRDEIESFVSNPFFS